MAVPWWPLFAWNGASIEMPRMTAIALESNEVCEPSVATAED